jgi:cellulose synthase/poly-beta-1,6-N-acetylglucosamine synthase-like glycosyltransferase
LLWTLIAWIALFPLLMANIVLAVELLAGRGMAPQQPADDVPSARKAVVVVPAHNEAEVIGGTIRALKNEAGDRYDLLVVADNCDDETAQVVRQNGVAVIERNNLEKVGKGYALSFARDYLSAARPEFVVVLDADCKFAEGSLSRLVAAAAAVDRTAQAEYLFQPALDAHPDVMVSNFAFFVKNSVRQRGLQQLGAPVVITGSGMAIPWHDMEMINAAEGSLVEDLEFGIELVKQGRAPVLASTARVWSRSASLRGTGQQRERWERGFLSSARRHAAPLLLLGIRQRSAGTLWLGLHLLVPPVALLCVLNLAGIALVAVAVGLGLSSVTPLLFLAVAAALTGVGLTSAWMGGGKRYLPLRGLARIPGYILWKFALYLRLVKQREARWTRTER